MRSPAAILRLHADLLEHGFDLRAAAVHDDRVDRSLLQQNDIPRKFAGQIFRAHGVAAVFDDDDFFVVALHIGQRFGQDSGLLERRHVHRELLRPPLFSRRGGGRERSIGRRHAAPRAAAGKSQSAMASSRALPTAAQQRHAVARCRRRSWPKSQSDREKPPAFSSSPPVSRPFAPRAPPR